MPTHKDKMAYVRSFKKTSKKISKRTGKGVFNPNPNIPLGFTQESFRLMSNPHNSGSEDYERYRLYGY
jgi:hypothetical protein